MNKIDNVFSIMDEYGFRVRNYTEGGKLCGYEIEGWTSHCDIDMPIFIDLRGMKITAENILFQLTQYVENFDSQREAAFVYDNDDSYDLRELLDDFDNFESTLLEMCQDIENMIEVS